MLFEGNPPKDFIDYQMSVWTSKRFRQCLRFFQNFRFVYIKPNYCFSDFYFLANAYETYSEEWLNEQWVYIFTTDSVVSACLAILRDVLQREFSREKSSYYFGAVVSVLHAVASFDPAWNSTYGYRSS